LSRTGHLAALTVDTFADTLATHGVDPAKWYDEEGALSLDRARAKEFLDLLEGRWWTADFSNERRRADRFRSR
jgi:hypothetical protein